MRRAPGRRRRRRRRRREEEVGSNGVPLVPPGGRGGRQRGRGEGKGGPPVDDPPYVCAVCRALALASVSRTPPPRNLGRVQLRRHFAEMWAPLCDRCRNLGHLVKVTLRFIAVGPCFASPPPATSSPWRPLRRGRRAHIGPRCAAPGELTCELVRFQAANKLCLAGRDELCPQAPRLGPPHPRLPLNGTLLCRRRAHLFALQPHRFGVGPLGADLRVAPCVDTGTLVSMRSRVQMSFLPSFLPSFRRPLADYVQGSLMLRANKRFHLLG